MFFFIVLAPDLVTFYYVDDGSLLYIRVKHKFLQAAIMAAFGLLSHKYTQQGAGGGNNNSQILTFPSFLFYVT